MRPLSPLLSRVIPLPKPLPHTGQLGLWTVNEPCTLALHRAIGAVDTATPAATEDGPGASATRKGKAGARRKSVGHSSEEAPAAAAAAAAGLSVPGDSATGPVIAKKTGRGTKRVRDG